TCAGPGSMQQAGLHTRPGEVAAGRCTRVEVVETGALVQGVEVDMAGVVAGKAEGAAGVEQAGKVQFEGGGDRVHRAAPGAVTEGIGLLQRLGARFPDVVSARSRFGRAWVGSRRAWRRAASTTEWA